MDTSLKYLVLSYITKYCNLVKLVKYNKFITTILVFSMLQLDVCIVSKFINISYIKPMVYIGSYSKIEKMARLTNLTYCRFHVSDLINVEQTAMSFIQVYLTNKW